MAVCEPLPVSADRDAVSCAAARVMIVAGTAAIPTPTAMSAAVIVATAATESFVNISNLLCRVMPMTRMRLGTFACPQHDVRDSSGHGEIPFSVTQELHGACRGRDGGFALS